MIQGLLTKSQFCITNESKVLFKKVKTIKIKNVTGCKDGLVIYVWLLFSFHALVTGVSLREWSLYCFVCYMLCQDSNLTVNLRTPGSSHRYKAQCNRGNNAVDSYIHTIEDKAVTTKPQCPSLRPACLGALTCAKEQSGILIHRLSDL